MTSKKRLVLLLAGLAILLAAVCFRDTLLLHIAPKAVLTSSVNTAFSRLEERFRNSPAVILENALDPEGKYTAQLKLNTDNRLLGPVTYDMEVQTDAVNRCLSAEGIASTAKKEIDLSLYMDTDFMSVSSDSLVSGNYYGIRYDSFREDLLSIPLLKYVISDNMLSQWDSSVKGIQAQMQQLRPLPTSFQLPTKDLHKLLLAMLALPCRVEKTAFLFEDQTITCRKLEYTISGEAADLLLSKLSGKEPEESVSMTASFYLYEKNVIKIVFSCDSQEKGFQILLELGTDPLSGPLSLQTVFREGEATQYLTALVKTRQAENRYSESWDVRFIADQVTKNLSLSYDWEPASGAAQLNVDNSENTISLIFQEREQGFYVVTEDFRTLWGSLTQKKLPSFLTGEIACTLAVQKGSQIAAPAYKNLSQWSMEDFLSLLSGVGGLFGLKLPF